jgi:hypothetical protein
MENTPVEKYDTVNHTVNYTTVNYTTNKLRLQRKLHTLHYKTTEGQVLVKQVDKVKQFVQPATNSLLMRVAKRIVCGCKLVLSIRVHLNEDNNTDQGRNTIKLSSQGTHLVPQQPLGRQRSARRTQSQSQIPHSESSPSPISASVSK